MPEVTLEGRPLPICPYGADKNPTCQGGFNSASADPAAIETLWRRWPGPLVGVRTGEASGIAVLDIDTKNKGEAWLADFYGYDWPRTRCHASQSGGMHFIFRHREGLKSSRDLIARGIDVRADGGAIIWWPQAGFRVLAEAPVAPWPASLDQALAEGEARRGRKAAENHARYDAALRERRKDAPLSSYRTVPVPLYKKLNKLMPWDLNQRRVRGILSVVTEKDEGRNDALYWASRRLRELIASGVVTRAVAEELLLDAAHLSRYVLKDGVGDAMDTIHSGLGPDLESGASSLSDGERVRWMR